MTGKRSHGSQYVKSTRKWGDKFAGLTMASKADALARQRLNTRTGGFRGLELKYYDSGRELFAIPAPTTVAGGEADPATLNTLVVPIPGTGPTNRIGRKVTWKNITVKGNVISNVQANQTATDVNPTIFIALVLDTQTNAAQLNSEDVFVNTQANAFTATCLFRELEYSQRFKVLKVKTMVLDMPTISWDGTNIEQSGTSKPFQLSWTGNVVTNYNATGGGSVADIIDNSFHVIAFSSSVTMVPLLNYNCRGRFLDA